MTVFQCPHRQIEGGDRIQHQQHGAVMRILQDNQCKDQSVSGMWYALSKTSGALDVSRGDASKMLGTVPSTRKSSATAVKCYLRYPLPTPRHLPDPVTGMNLTESPLTSLTTPQEGFTCRLACAPPSLGCDPPYFQFLTPTIFVSQDPDITLLSLPQPHAHWGFPPWLVPGFWDRSGQSPQLGKLEGLWVKDTTEEFTYLPEESTVPFTHPRAGQDLMSPLPIPGHITLHWVYHWVSCFPMPSLRPLLECQLHDHRLY